MDKRLIMILNGAILTAMVLFAVAVNADSIRRNPRLTKQQRCALGIYKQGARCQGGPRFADDNQYYRSDFNDIYPSLIYNVGPGISQGTVFSPQHGIGYTGSQGMQE